MACFLVPTAEAIITTIMAKTAKSHETKAEKSEKSKKTAKLSQRLNRLSGFLWGGSALLAFEHIWHGEVTAWFPFLTAASNPEDMTAMLCEMSTAGVSMALLVTAVWAVIEIILSRVEKRKNIEAENRAEEAV